MHMYQGMKSGNCTFIQFYEEMEKDVGIISIVLCGQDLQFIQMFILA